MPTAVIIHPVHSSLPVPSTYTPTGSCQQEAAVRARRARTRAQRAFFMTWEIATAGLPACACVVCCAASCCGLPCTSDPGPVDPPKCATGERLHRSRQAGGGTPAVMCRTC